MADRTRRSTDALALIAFCGFLFLLGLQIVGLVGADEPRYAQVAREMLARHDWVTPVLYGHPWLEKPPLYYWCAMLAYKGAGGVSDTAARLPSAVLSSLLIVFIYVWARRFRRGMQLDAALITASAAIIIGFGRSASTDMPLTVMFTVAMLAWYGWYASGKRSWLLAFYFFMALATLAKGPVAVFLAAADHCDLRRAAARWPPAAAHLVAHRHRALPGRGRAVVHRRAARESRILPHLLPAAQSRALHQQSLSPSAAVLVLPASGAAGAGAVDGLRVAALVDAIRDWRFSVQQPAGQEDLRTYLALWLLLPIVFFSLSHSKLPGYILPGIPAATILAGRLHPAPRRRAVKPRDVDGRAARIVVGRHADRGASSFRSSC